MIQDVLGNYITVEPQYGCDLKLYRYFNRVVDWKVFFMDFMGIDDSYFKGDGGELGGVYKIDDVYIGQSFNIRNRLKKHISNSINGRHNNKKLMYYIMNKISMGEKFNFEILSRNIRDERYFMEKLDRNKMFCNLSCSIT